MLTMSDIGIRLSEVTKVGEFNGCHRGVGAAEGHVSGIGIVTATEADRPHFGSLAKVFPVKLAAVFRRELIVQRQRIVIVAQDQRICW